MPEDGYPTDSEQRVGRYPLDIGGINVEEYTAAVEAEFDRITELMQDTWGYAPEFKPKVEVMLKVSADFDLQGFAHDTRSVQVHPRNVKRRTPEKVAREIASEVTSHRNTCDRCGEGNIPSLWTRLHAVDPDHRWHQVDNDGMVEFSRPVLDEQGNPVLKEGDGGHMYPQWERVKGYAYTPADAVELYLEPGRAKRLNKWLAAHEAKLEAERQERLAREAKDNYVPFSGS